MSYSGYKTVSYKGTDIDITVALNFIMMLLYGLL